MTAWMAPASCSRLGCSATSSSGRQPTTAPSGLVTRMGGASTRISSTAVATISAPSPQNRLESSITTSRPVLSSDAASPSQSNGYSVRGSTTSTETSPSRSAATARASCTRCPTASTVTSVPGRCTRLTPSGTGTRSPGTTFSRTPCAAIGAKNVTGSFSLIALTSRPYASVGVAGSTVLTPQCANMLYGWSECCPPQPGRQPAAGSRNVTGTLACPPVITDTLFAWLAICSNTSSKRNGIWYSTTGRRPASAAPSAKSVNPCSDSGVSTTRSGPNRSSSPVVVLVRACRMSSPMMKTAGSRSISSPIARLTALK